MKLRIMADECSELYYIDQKVEKDDSFSTIIDVSDEMAESILKLNKEYWDMQEYLEYVIKERY